MVAVLGNASLSASATWLNIGEPYRLLGNLTVPITYTLSMPSPLNVQLSNATGIYVAGTLNMTGTATTPISLTTAATTQAPGGYGGIAFQPGSAGRLSYVHLSYGGYYITDHSGGTYYTSMLIEGSSPTISNSSFDTSYGSGVEVRGGGAPIFNLDSFTNEDNSTGQYAIQVDDNASVATLTNDKFGNSIQVSTDGANLPIWPAARSSRDFDAPWWPYLAALRSQPARRG